MTVAVSVSTFFHPMVNSLEALQISHRHVYILPHYVRPNIKQLNYMGTKTSES